MKKQLVDKNNKTHFMILYDCIRHFVDDQELGKFIRTSYIYETRPWGHFEVLAEGPNCKVKLLVIKPGKRISYQYHKHRLEHWVIIQGVGNFILDAKNTSVEPGMFFSIQPEQLHRIHNTGSEDLIIIETQLGKCDESDIVRIDDDYNR